MVKIFDKSEKTNMAELFNAVKAGEDLILRTYTYDDEYDYIIERILEKILAKYNIEIIKNALTFCIRELTGNSRKAIVKRIFFKDKKLDLNSEKDYNEGMKLFHKHIYNEIDSYTDRMKQEGYFISFNVKHNKNQIDIRVESNTNLTKHEKLRINSKLSRVKGLQDLGSNLDTIIDTTEGAGLGLIMLVMMLQKEGIKPEAFDIATQDDKTISIINFKINELEETPFSIIAKALINEIENLPQFPENVSKVLSIMDDETSSMNKIANVIMQDPSMAADLLKLANSAFFMLPKRVSNITEALKIVGLKGLRNLLYSYGTVKTLTQKYGKYGKLDEIWSHSNKVSFYGVELTKMFNLKDIVEDVSISSLLHDLGKIIIMTLHPEKIENIKTIVTEKENIPSHMVEELIVGINHAKLGALMGKHWNFPENLVKAIEYHHVPGFASEDLAPLVYTVYFANALTDIERGMITFRNVNREVLAFFKIKTEEDLKKIHKKIVVEYQNRLKERKKLDRN